MRDDSQPDTHGHTVDGEGTIPEDAEVVESDVSWGEGDDEPEPGGPSWRLSEEPPELRPDGRGEAPCVADLEAGDRLRLPRLGAELEVDWVVGTDRVETISEDVLDAETLQECIDDGIVEVDRR